MDKNRRVEEIIETNFRLNALHTRELGVEMRRRMDQQSRDLQEGLRKLSDQVDSGFRDLGDLFENGMNAQADRMDNVVHAIRMLGDGSTDLRKEIDELKRRVQDLEDRAS